MPNAKTYKIKIQIQMIVSCNQSSNLLATLKHNCKNLTQIYQVHAQAITRGLFNLHPNLLTQILQTFTSLLKYSKFSNPISDFHYVINVFGLIHNPSALCYNTVIRAHTLLSSPETALKLFVEMSQKGIPPDSYTFPFVLKACADYESLSLVETLHCQALRFGVLADVYVCNNLVRVYSDAGEVCKAYNVFDECLCKDVVSYNSMIDGFVKVGETGKARELFESMTERDSITWGTLLAGYAKMDQFEETIELYDRMLSLEVKRDNVALIATLSACSQLGKLEKGRRIHDYILQENIEIDAFLATGLVDLYAKCGNIQIAKEIFDSSCEKNLCTWNAMLVGLAMHGHGKQLLDYFGRMIDDGIKPDGVTFLAVLVGCSHVGLIDEAKWAFSEMEGSFGVRRELKHYGCMADLLARAGLINEAIKMIETMPMGADVFVWGGLLGGCRMHNDLDMAEKAAEQVIALKPGDGGAYSVLANVYANAERWDDLVNIRRLRDSDIVKKKAGCSIIQLDGIAHEFVSGDDLHPFTEEIFMILSIMKQHKVETT